MNTSQRETLMVFVMIGMLVVPSILTLRTIDDPGTLVIGSDNPTPLGYTWSLSLFIVPLLTIAWWFLRHPDLGFHRKAYWTTIAVMVPIGFGLDLLFARSFFKFPNTGSVLGIEVPGVGGGIPIEEFAFYLTGFMFVLLFYIWNDEHWLAAYNVPDYPKQAKKLDRILHFHWRSVLAGALLVLAAVVYKKFFSASPEGFPAYFTFLVAGAIVPAAGFFHSVRSFINWRAFSFTFFFVLLVSLLWEATLGLPYGWWGFQSDKMIGIFVGAWSDLPIEEPFVWFMVSFTTIIVFEVVKIWRATGHSLRRAMFGTEG